MMFGSIPASVKVRKPSYRILTHFQMNKIGNASATPNSAFFPVHLRYC